MVAQLVDVFILYMGVFENSIETAVSFSTLETHLSRSHEYSKRRFGLRKSFQQF